MSTTNEPNETRQSTSTVILPPGEGSAWDRLQRGLQEDKRVYGPMWSVGVRLSLLAVLILPSVALWATTPHERAALIMRATTVTAPFILALVAALLIGFISWNKAFARATLLGGTAVLYSIPILALGVIESDKWPSYLNWTFDEWLYVGLWIAAWGLTFWCTWVLVRNVAYPLLRRRMR